MKKILALALALSIPFPPIAAASVYGRTVYGKTSLKIEEEDGSPSRRVVRIKVPNNSLTDEGGGVLSIDFVAGLPPGSIGTDLLADLAVTSDKLAPNAVLTSKINADAVTNAKVLTDAIDARTIAASAVDTSELNDSSVTTSKLAPDSVTASKILTDAVGSDAIAANAVGSSEIATNAVGADEIQTDGVASDEIAANAVDTSEINDSAVTTSKIDADAVTNVKLITDAVDSRVLASNSVGSSEIQDAAVTTTKIGDGSVTTSKLSDGSILQRHLAAGVGGHSDGTNCASGQFAQGTNADGDAQGCASVSTTFIDNGAITTSKIGSGAVTSSKIFDAAVTTVKLADDAVTTSKIHSEAFDRGENIILQASGGSVGIGITNPGIIGVFPFTSVLLHVKKTSGTGQMVMEGLTRGGITLVTSQATANKRIYQIRSETATTGGAGTDAQFQIVLWNDNEGLDTNLFDITSSGDIGIGTTNPIRKLDVTGTFHTTGDATFDGDILCTTCIDESDIAASAVTSGKIADGSVTTGKLGPDITLNPFSIAIAGGATVIGKLSGTQSLNFGAIGGVQCSDLTMTVTGAADGDAVYLGIPNALASTTGLQFSGFVSASDTVTVRACCNNGETAGVADSCSDPAAATVRAVVEKF